MERLLEAVFEAIVILKWKGKTSYNYYYKNFIASSEM